MKTEQIIETLLDWKRTWKPTGKVGLTLDAAIERLQTLENNYAEMGLDFRKQYVELEREHNYWKEESEISKDREKCFEIQIEHLKKERDEAIERLQELEKPREKTRAYWVGVKWNNKFPYKLPQKKENRHND